MSKYGSMPRIFDNIENRLVDALRNIMAESERSDICVGYFRLRGWERLMDLVERFAGTDESCCRLLIGMQRPPEETMRELQRVHQTQPVIDGSVYRRARQQTVQHFKEQIEFGLPTAAAEKTLRLLAKQIRQKKVRVKLFLRYPLHAKLYLIQRHDTAAPLIGFLGSSNLTLSGLAEQGELNIDVVEQDAAQKLQAWFNERWNDTGCIDISDDLAKLIEQSWAGEAVQAINNLPYLVYLRIAYHLSEDARTGEIEFKLPRDLRDVLLDFQVAAVQLAARLLYRHQGVLLGDVVGLGKTLMAIALARVFQDADQSRTLVICPPKLEAMWKWHIRKYNLMGETLSLGRVGELESTIRYRTLVIDESHNLRNRSGVRYRAIQNYIGENEPRVILLTATPYNKQFEDLGNQLRLFVDEDQSLPARPERFFKDWFADGKNEAQFQGEHQVSPRSIRAFELSQYADDWRDLMRLFMVRRTRSFIIENYARYDEQKQRYYVHLNGRPNYFPFRQPHTVKYHHDEAMDDDQYARLFHSDVVQLIEDLALPRYGLWQYLIPNAHAEADNSERQIINDLSKAGKRLIGFCRTNLFKRLESSGQSFLQSVDRHILRNMIICYAIESGNLIPIGTQDVVALDTAVTDADADYIQGDTDFANDLPPENQTDMDQDPAGNNLWSMDHYRQRAATTYRTYRSQFRARFKWISPHLFEPELQADLLNDAQQLLSLRQKAGKWNAKHDTKLNKLYELIEKEHGCSKVLIFTQFADTALYLYTQLINSGVNAVAVATADSADPVSLARRFSPSSNGGLRTGETELRVLIATDVMSEGQNLQDCHVIINYDLPWAIIRLIQRAGRVDRIGQNHDTIHVYSFLPADGVEEIIRLRTRLSQRLQNNQEVVGTDESFFGEKASQHLEDLFNEESGVLDDDSDDSIDIDLTSLAQKVWNEASEEAQKMALDLPPVVYATRAHTNTESSPTGEIVYLRIKRGSEMQDALVRVDEEGQLISQSLSTLFTAVACAPDTPNVQPLINHFDLVHKAVEYASQEVQSHSGQLGRAQSVRRRLYERLRSYREQLMAAAHPTDQTSQMVGKIDAVVNAIYHAPLTEYARDQLSNHLRLGASAQDIAEIAYRQHEDGRLVQEVTPLEDPEPQIVCSMGLRKEA